MKSINFYIIKIVSITLKNYITITFNIETCNDIVYELKFSEEISLNAESFCIKTSNKKKSERILKITHLIRLVPFHLKGFWMFGFDQRTESYPTTMKDNSYA